MYKKPARTWIIMVNLLTNTIRGIFTWKQHFLFCSLFDSFINNFYYSRDRERESEQELDMEIGHTMYIWIWIIICALMQELSCWNTRAFATATTSKYDDHKYIIPQLAYRKRKKKYTITWATHRKMLTK